MDRLAACGSKRPALIADESIVLRLPSWSPNPASLALEGEFFQNGSNLQYHSGTGKKSQGSSGMLIDIMRVLGITNRYLAAGGVKGDSHFPWHSLSNLSKIRRDLDTWVSGTQDVFISVESLFHQSDSTTLVLSKLIYHLIHVLIYRPFLPIDLAELAGTGQHQSWQIEATNLCFLHANAITELVELGKQAGSVEWPAFVGYCICTAGTVHVHGAHYKGGHDGEIFSTSADFLSREMQQLSELRYLWTSAQQQRETLQALYTCHSELVKALVGNPLRYSPVFHLEDFFDRYASTRGQYFDHAHVSFADVKLDAAQETFIGHGLYARRPSGVVAAGPSSSNGGRAQGGGSGAAERKRSIARKKREKNIQSDGNAAAEAYQRSLTTTNNGDSFVDHLVHNQAHDQQPPMPQQSHSLSTPAFDSVLLPPTIQTYTYTHPLLGTGTADQPTTTTYDPMFGVPPSLPPSHRASISHANNPFAPPDHQPQSQPGQGQQVLTPGGRSANGSFAESLAGSNGEEKDPFLSLLEQLAENEHSRGGPSELDFFLSSGAG